MAPLWYAPHSQPGDLVVADSGVDQSFAFTAGIAVVLGVSNAPKAEGGAEAPPPPPPPAPNARPREQPSDDEAGGARGQRFRSAEPVRCRYAMSSRLLLGNSSMKSAPQAPAGVWNPEGRAPRKAREASSTAVQLVSS